MRKSPAPIDTPLCLLVGLRRRHPWMTLRWDRRTDRAVATPGSRVALDPALVAELRAAKTRISPLLRWEERHGEVALTRDQEEKIEWLYREATEGFYPRSFQLAPGRTVVDAVALFDALRLEAALGPAYPGWERVLEDLGRLMEMEKTGLL